MPPELPGTKPGERVSQVTASRDPETERGPSLPGRADAMDHGRRELMSLMTSKVRDALVRKPYFVDGETDIVTLCRELSSRGLGDALVRDGERIGVFTTTDLRDALLRPEPLAGLAVREVTTFDPWSVSVEDELFDAMILMVRHRIHRVVVREGGMVVGVLGQLEVMSFVANHSHVIALQAAEAADLVELRAAAGQIDGLIQLLHQDGVRVDIISGLVGGLNRAVLHRLWDLLAPRELRDNSCLIVMGSEGRSEQVIKTDQDNALLLSDGFSFDGLDAITDAFTAALIDFGYPPCPGGIMLSRSLWRQSVSDFRGALRNWIHGSDPHGPMNLAIFLDAAVVAGDEALLDETRAYVDQLLSDSDIFYAHFASAIDQFATSWWTRLPGLSGRAEATIDLKKLGIFPIVHGIRALSLQYRVRAVGTVDRIRALLAQGRLGEPLGRDLIDALHFLIELKLTTNLRQLAEGRAPDNLIRLNELGTLERQALKDSLAIVRRFKQWLGRHYRLDAL